MTPSALLPTMRTPPLALRNVMYGGYRSLLAIAGVGFSITLVLLQLGFLEAVRITATTVYDQLERRDAIDEEDVEHGVKEHDEGYETLLPLLEATELYDEDFSENLHEFSETLMHHLDEEERDILNPAREEVSEEERARLGAAWAAERNRMLDEGCGSVEQVRSLLREAQSASSAE